MRRFVENYGLNDFMSITVGIESEVRPPFTGTQSEGKARDLPGTSVLIHLTAWPGYTIVTG